MEHAATEFLKKHRYPQHCNKLLEFYGCSSIDDFSQLGPEDIDSIEEKVIQGEFSKFFDTTSRSAKIEATAHDRRDKKFLGRIQIC